MESIGKIKKKYKKLESKGQFIQNVADELGLSPLYVRNTYFSGFWSIPEDKQEKILEMLEELVPEEVENEK